MFLPAIHGTFEFYNASRTQFTDNSFLVTRNS